MAAPIRLKTYPSILLLALCTSTCLYAQTPPDISPTDSIPFEIGTDRNIYIHLRINDDNTPLRFMFDTGATENVVNARSEQALRTLQFADSIKISGTDSSQHYKKTDFNNSIRFGGTSMDGIRFVTADFPQEFVFDGICGVPLFTGLDFRIDYDSQYIYFYNMGTFVPGEEYTEIPLRTLKNNLYAAELDFEYGPLPLTGWFMLDSGSDSSITFSSAFIKESEMENIQHPWFKTQAVGIGGNKRDIEFIFLKNITFGKYTLYKIPAALNIEDQGAFASSGTAGSIGNNLLQRFNQVWFPLSQKLYITPNNRMYVPFYDKLIKNKVSLGK